MTTVLLLYPGEMGASLGKSLVEIGHRVLWLPAGRSQATRDRAEAANLNTADSLDHALEQAEVVLSVCPPQIAHEVGKSVSLRKFGGIYCDSNPIAPSTAQTIQELFGGNYVDGVIFGPRPAHDLATRLYLSGPRATEVRELFYESNLSVRVLDAGNLAASALKMCDAAYFKGTMALLLASRALATANGVTEELEFEWNLSQPDAWSASDSDGPRIGRKAWRFAPEMREIAKTFRDANLPADTHTGIAKMFEVLSSFKGAPSVQTRELIEALLTEKFD